MHRRPYCVLSLVFTGVLTTLSPPSLAQQSSTTQSPPAIPATDWAWHSGWGEAAMLSAGAGLSLGSLLLHQQRSSWGPDATKSSGKGPVYTSHGTVSAAIAVAAVHYVMQGERFRGVGLRSPYLSALPLLFADIEAVTIAGGVTHIVEKRTGRCRPRQWHQGVCDPGSDDNFKAFPSGHTTMASSLAGVHLVESLRLHSPDTLMNWLPYILIESAAVSTGALRVMAGAHSWSDVGVAFVFGHLTGVAVALAHPETTLKSPSNGSGFVNPSVSFDGKTLTLGAAF
jgi:membrane-associated phospholipid phosphatase